MSSFIQRQKKRLTEIAAKTPHLIPFQDDSPAAKDLRITTATADGWPAFEFFCLTYFPHVFALDFIPAHKTMFSETEAATGIITITGFRGLGKTVLIGLVYPIWKLATGYSYIIHAAADIELAQERTAFTLHELRKNRRLRSDFPFLEVVEGEKDDFFLKNKARIRARSIKQSFRGTFNPLNMKRPPLIVCDDIDKEENIGSQKIGKKKLDKITQELAGALDPASPGKVIWLGNLVHPNYAICQFEQLIMDEIRADSPDLDIRHSPVLKATQKLLLRFPLEDPDGRSNWEAQYPTASLPQLRIQYGAAGYQREMLGLPVIEGNIFKAHWFARYRHLPDNMKRVWLYADPAWGEKGCYKAVISIGYDGSRFYVIHCWIRQTENTKYYQYYYDTFRFLDSVYRSRFRAAQDATFGQTRIIAEFDRWARDRHLPPIGHRIKPINLKENKNLRIERTETTIETAKILFPHGQDVPTLISQFLTYPDGYIDGPDALAGALERFHEYDIGRNRIKIRKIFT